MTDDLPPELPGPMGEPWAEELVVAVYADLRRMAEAHFRGERDDHTLQPTAIVHEAYLRLHRLMPDRIRDRVHFLALASTTMRRVLIDYARARAAESRGGDLQRVTLLDDLVVDKGQEVEILALDRALAQLRDKDPIAAEVVELRFFGGLTEEEVAQVLRFSVRKAQLVWSHARAWLRREMGAGAAPME